MWSVWNTDNFRDAILLAANLADDADSVAATAGQIAGRCMVIPLSRRTGKINSYNTNVLPQWRVNYSIEHLRIIFIVRITKGKRGHMMTCDQVWNF